MKRNVLNREFKRGVMNSERGGNEVGELTRL